MPTAHSTLSGLDLHEDKRFKIPVRVASTINVVVAAPGPTIDGITLISGDRVLLKNQSLPAQNGIYVWTASATALARATDADVAADFALGFLVYANVGTVNASTLWLFSTSTTPLVLGTTPIAFTVIGSTGPTGPTGSQGPAGQTGAAGPPGSTIVSGAAPYICIQDRKTAGTGGGTFTSGADRTRDLNTIVANDQNLAVLTTATNRITLPAGTWRCHITVPAYGVQYHRAWLYNVTDSGEILSGQSAYTHSASTTSNQSVIAGRFALASSKALEIRHRCASTLGTSGFGIAVGGQFTVPYEVYTIAEFWLEAGPPPFFDIANESEGGEWDWRRDLYWSDNDDE